MNKGRFFRWVAFICFVSSGFVMAYLADVGLLPSRWSRWASAILIGLAAWLSPFDRPTGEGNFPFRSRRIGQGTSAQPPQKRESAVNQ